MLFFVSFLTFGCIFSIVTVCVNLIIWYELTQCRIPCQTVSNLAGGCEIYRHQVHQGHDCPRPNAVLSCMLGMTKNPRKHSIWPGPISFEPVGSVATGHLCGSFGDKERSTGVLFVTMAWATVPLELAGGRIRG